MPLLINGERIDLARPTGDMIRTYPHLEEKAKQLRSQPPQIVEPKGLLYVQQREFAVTTPKDGSVSILGSDDATTCHIVVLRHTGSGATCLTHCDGSDTEAEVSLIMSSVKSFSDTAGYGRNSALGLCPAILQCTALVMPPCLYTAPALPPVSLIHCCYRCCRSIRSPTR